MALVVFAFIVVIFICAAVARQKRIAAVFAERFPPLSDAEYVARCAPGTDLAVALRVRRVLSEALNIDSAEIYPSSRLIGDLGAE